MGLPSHIKKKVDKNICLKNEGKTTEYKAWSSMRARCYDKKYQHKNLYENINVCERWLKSYKYFIEDMGRKPSSEYSLDRIDPNGNYEKSNCRWATKSEQRLNTRKSKKAKTKYKFVSKEANAFALRRRGVYFGRFKTEKEAYQHAKKIGLYYDQDKNKIKKEKI